MSKQQKTIWMKLAEKKEKMNNRERKNAQQNYNHTHAQFGSTFVVAISFFSLR